MSATGKMPPLPTLDDSQIGYTDDEASRIRTQEAFDAGFHRGKDDPLGFDKSFARQSIEAAHKGRIATAQRHYQNALTYYQVLSGGTNPNTGQPLTPDEMANYQQMLDGAWTDLSKVAGLDKETKAELERRKQMMDGVLTHGHERIGQVIDSLNQGTGNMPPPPAPDQNFNSSASMVAPLIAPNVQGQAQQRAATAANVETARTAGLTPGTRDYEQAVVEGKLPTLRAITAKTYQDTDGTLFSGHPDVTTGQIVNADTGEVVPGAVAVTAGMMAPPKILTNNGGVPYAISRQGLTLTPDSPGWTDHDQELLDHAKAAWDQGEQAKTTRQQEWQSAYVKMRGQVQLYDVMDLATGDPVKANANEINASPGKYAPLGAAQQLRNREQIFKEIDYSTTALDKALGNLTDADDFAPNTKMQIAFAMRDTDPRSAIQTLITNGALGTLTTPQQEYIAALTSATESALALRSIAGMGQGSDMLRAAIINMLPGAATPTKAYGQLQMKLLHGQVDSLHSAIPPSIQGAGNAGKTWSKAAWAKANPGKDADDAERRARVSGYKVVP